MPIKTIDEIINEIISTGIPERDPNAIYSSDDLEEWTDFLRNYSDEEED